MKHHIPNIVGGTQGVATSASYSTTTDQIKGQVVDTTPLSGVTIPSGSYITYQGGEYVVDVVEGIANNNVAFVTPWGFSLKMNQTQQQFFIRVDGAAGVARYNWGSKTSYYHRVVNNVGDGPVFNYWAGPIANSWYAWWTDNLLQLSYHGDFEWGTFRAAPSKDAFSLGQYEEYEVTMTLGSAYNNNYFRVRKTK